MTGGSTCAWIRLELGVYLLGAIEPAQRARVDHHLATCPSCRAELAALAGLPDLLRRVPADEATELSLEDTIPAVPGPPPGALLRRMAGGRRRSVLTVAAALVAGFAAALGGRALHAAAEPPATTAQAITADAANPATGAWAAVRYTPQPWGTKLAVRVTGIPAGTRCQLLVMNTRGQDIAAGGSDHRRGPSGHVVPASAPFQATRLRGFEVTTSGRILVTVAAR